MKTLVEPTAQVSENLPPLDQPPTVVSSSDYFQFYSDGTYHVSSEIPSFEQAGKLANAGMQALRIAERYREQEFHVPGIFYMEFDDGGVDVSVTSNPRLLYEGLQMAAHEATFSCDQRGHATVLARELISFMTELAYKDLLPVA